MNYKLMARYCAFLLLVLAVFMLPALGLCLYDGDMPEAFAFGVTAGGCGLISLPLFLVSKNSDKRFLARDGLVCTALCWIIMSAAGAIPYTLSGAIPNYLDAFFESVSGFTTTGASIVTDVEGLARGINYWRCFGHWLGGMGVLVFLMAVLPASGMGGINMHLLRAESPGPEIGKLRPKMRSSAMVLYGIYIGLTVLDFLFLWAGEMDAFEAVCTALGSAGTGGFGIKADSMGSFSRYSQVVTVVFLFLFGVNFNVYYLLLMKQWKAALRDEELHCYLMIAGSSILLIAINLTKAGVFSGFGEALHQSAFNVASIMTTAGYCTCDTELWPTFSKVILIFLMFCGACAGSTGGGMKVVRLMLTVKSGVRSIRKTLHPTRLQRITYSGRVADEETVTTVNNYLGIYAALFILSLLLVSLEGESFMTSFSAVAACINNVGPGFEAVGATANYAGLAPLTKLVLIADMLAGRLELIPMLVLFSVDTWRGK